MLLIAELLILSLMLVIYNFNYRQSKIFFSLHIEVISQEIV